MGERRDRMEMLHNCNCQFVRCIGGHITNSGFVCQLCDSDNPSTICFKEKVRHKSEIISDYTDPKVQRKIRKFDVVK